MATQPDGMSEQALNTLLSRRKDFLGFIEKRVGSRAVAEDIRSSWGNNCGTNCQCGAETKTSAQ